MDETFANYLAADPATGGDVKTLNLPAVRDMDCTPNCSWTRTVRNTLDVAQEHPRREVVRLGMSRRWWSFSGL